MEEKPEHYVEHHLILSKTWNANTRTENYEFTKGWSVVHIDQCKGPRQHSFFSFWAYIAFAFVCKICIPWPGLFHPPNSYFGGIQISVHSPPWIKVHVSVSHITKHKVITYIPNLRLHRFVSLVTLLRTLGFLRAIMRLLNRMGALLNYTLSMWFSWEPTHWHER